MDLEEVSPVRAAAETNFNVTESYAAHGGALFAHAFNALGDRAEAEDCVQEAFIRAWRSRGRYSSSRGSVRTWLFAIERNLIIDCLRARARRPAPSDAEKIEWASEPVTEDLLIVERLVLYESLATLTSEHREVIVAVQLDGRSYQELSEQTGVPVATLRTRMYYGLKSLRTALGAHAHDGGSAWAVGGASRRG
nr:MULTISPECIES: sigma-70 family RNA polymerase sigma factor [unclassified Nesterenkonia]